MRVCLEFLGDISFHGALGDTPRQEALQLLEPLWKVESKKSLRFANFESALVRSQSSRLPIETRPEHLSLLRDLGVRVVSLANNHVLDCGREALLQLKSELERLGIITVGAGADARDSSQLKTVEINGLTVGFLAFMTPFSFTSESRIWAMAAGESHPGVNCYAPAESLREIAEARAHADVLVVSIHGGTIGRLCPEARFAAVCDEVARAGAQIVVGHHAHVVQPYRLRNGALVHFGLGNAIFPDFQMTFASGGADRSLLYKNSRRERVGVLLRTEVADRRVTAVEQHFFIWRGERNGGVKNLKRSPWLHRHIQAAWNHTERRKNVRIVSLLEGVLWFSVEFRRFWQRWGLTEGLRRLKSRMERRLLT